MSRPRVRELPNRSGSYGTSQRSGAVSFRARAGSPAARERRHDREPVPRQLRDLTHQADAAGRLRHGSHVAFPVSITEVIALLRALP